MATTYKVPLTGPQLRVLHDVLSLVLNDPHWPEIAATTERDMQTMARAHETIMEAWRTAKRAESTPAVALGSD